MTEVFFKATTPDGRTAVIVEHRDDESFYCTVVLDGRDVLEVFETMDMQKMAIWTRKQMLEAVRRSGN
jgi:hypothetical protein